MLREFFVKYESKIVLFLGLVLVAIISFEAGAIKGKKLAESPIIIENPAPGQSAAVGGSGNAVEAPKSAQEGQNSPETVSRPDQKCAYVGSKNSDKYHLPFCRWAKQIKPENVVCFSSEDEAKSKGYQADKNCIK